MKPSSSGSADRSTSRSSSCRSFAAIRSNHSCLRPTGRRCPQPKRPRSRRSTEDGTTKSNSSAAGPPITGVSESPAFTRLFAVSPPDGSGGVGSSSLTAATLRRSRTGLPVHPAGVSRHPAGAVTQSVDVDEHPPGRSSRRQGPPPHACRAVMAECIYPLAAEMGPSSSARMRFSSVLSSG